MKKRILNISLILMLASTGSVFAQQGFGTNHPDRSAAVEIKSINKGLLIPRMDLTIDTATAVISAPTINNPAQGLLVYNKTEVKNGSNQVILAEGFYYYSQGKWNPIGLSTLKDSSTTTITGNGTANQPYVVEVKNLAGDVTGNILTNKVERIQTVPVDGTAPTNGQVLKADSGTWKPSTLVATDISDPKTLSATKPLNANNGTGAVLKDVTLTVDTATASTLGVVKPGFGLDITDGTLSVNLNATDVQQMRFDSTTHQLSLERGGDVINLSSLITKLDTGTNTILVGTGAANNPYKVNVATADTNTLGVVQIGSGINVNNGVISVPAAPGETTTIIANTLTKTNKRKIADYKNETSATPVDIFETVTSITYDTNTNVTHVNEDTSTVVFNLGDEIRKHQKTSSVKGVGSIKVSPATANATGNTEYTVSVDTATANTLGVVKPGSGITVTADGTLNVLPQADTVTTLTGVKPTGNAIGTYKNEAGTDVVINETITSIKFDSTTSVLTYTPETGDSGTIQLNLSSINSDKQQLSLDSNTLKLERGGSVDLSKYLDNTDNQKLSLDTNTHILSITGDSNTVNLSNYKNKVYTLVSDTNTISLLADGTSVDSETVVKNVELELVDKKLTTKVNGVANSTALDLSVLNTDNQYLTYDSLTYTLAISGDTRTVNLSGLVTKLDTGTNTTLTGNGTAATPYKVGVNAGNGKNLGVVKEADSATTVNIGTDGSLAVNLTNTILVGEVTGPLNANIVANDVIDADNLKTNAVTTVKIANANVTPAKIQPATGDTTTSKVLTTNKSGVVEWSTSATPDFFYYPSILVPLSGNPSTNATYPSSAGYLELDLYGNYSSRWLNPGASSVGAESTNLASILIPEKMIDIYVTYFDPNVIKSGTADGIKIDGGKMYYKVQATPNITDASYMNIVFKVRKTPKP